MERRPLATVLSIDSANRSEVSSKYWRAWEPDPSNRNDSLTKLYDMIDPGSKVLDIGCAVGQLGAALRRDKGCTVYGIELDTASAKTAERVLDRVLQADIQSLSIEEAFPGERFDYVVFGDVIEHLREPLQILERAQKALTDEGALLISIPNVAHAAVRLALLGGSFDYVDAGLLDTTHLRMYTRKSLEELLEKAGLVPVELERTLLAVKDTEIPVRAQGLVTPDLITAAENEPEGMTYQFVVKALPLAQGKHKKLITRRILNLEALYGEASGRCLKLERELGAAKGHAAKLDSLERGFRDAQARIAGLEMEHKRSERALAELRGKLHEDLSHALRALVEGEGDLAKFRREIEQALVYVAQSCDQRIRQTHQLAAQADLQSRSVSERMARYLNLAPFRAIRKLRRKLFRIPATPV